MESFSTLFDQLPVGAYRTSPDGRLLRINPALAALNGFASEAALMAAQTGLTRDWYVDPGRRDAFVAALERDGFVRGFVSEVRRLATGERIWVSEHAHVVRDDEGRALYYEGTVEDVTERLRAEAALRDSEAHWRQVLDSSGDGVWEWDLESGRESFSPRFAEMYGFTLEELQSLPEPFVSRVHPEDEAQRRQHREAHFEGRAPRYVSEHRMRCKDGTWKWVLARGMVTRRDAQGRPLRMIVTHTDITRAKDAEALRRARDRAEAADRAKTDLLSRVSHELRTPLNGVLGFAQLLAQAPDLPPAHQSWVRHILSSGQHLLALVDDLLDLAGAESGALRLHPQAVDPLVLVHQAWTMLLPSARADGVDLDAPAAAGPALQVHADPQRLTQALTHLLSHALRHSPRGTAVRAAAQRLGPQVALSVSDAGTGLAAEQRARLFQPFERPGAEPVADSGLGLALSRQLIAAMGGEVRVDSAPGEGTTFTVVLPGA
jgi:PAS domain S-box-containing protein